MDPTNNMIREGVMEKTMENMVHIIVCVFFFFSVCHIGRIPPFLSFKSANFFPSHGFFSPKIQEASNDTCHSQLPPPPHGTGFTGHLQEMFAC